MADDHVCMKTVRSIISALTGSPEPTEGQIATNGHENGEAACSARTESAIGLFLRDESRSHSVLHVERDDSSDEDVDDDDVSKKRKRDHESKDCNNGGASRPLDVTSGTNVPLQTASLSTSLMWERGQSQVSPAPGHGGLASPPPHTLLAAVHVRCKRSLPPCRDRERV